MKTLLLLSFFLVSCAAPTASQRAARGKAIVRLERSGYGLLNFLSKVAVGVITTSASNYLEERAGFRK